MILVILSAIMFVAMMFSFFTFVIVMMALRLYEARKQSLSLKETLLVTLTPFSLGYYFILKDKVTSKLYEGLMIAYFAITLFGIMFTLYQFLI